MKKLRTVYTSLWNKSYKSHKTSDQICLYIHHRLQLGMRIWSAIVHVLQDFFQRAGVPKYV